MSHMVTVLCCLHNSRIWIKINYIIKIKCIYYMINYTNYYKGRYHWVREGWGWGM